MFGFLLRTLFWKVLDKLEEREYLEKVVAGLHLWKICRIHSNCFLDSLSAMIRVGFLYTSISRVLAHYGSGTNGFKDKGLESLKT